MPGLQNWNFRGDCFCELKWFQERNMREQKEIERHDKGNREDKAGKNSKNELHRMASGNRTSNSHVWQELRLCTAGSKRSLKGQAGAREWQPLRPC